MDNEIIVKITNFAKISAIIGVCTLGICPAFAIMSIVVGIVLKTKGVSLEGKCASNIKKGYILGGVALLMFVADILILLHFAG